MLVPRDLVYAIQKDESVVFSYPFVSVRISRQVFDQTAGHEDIPGRR